MLKPAHVLIGSTGLATAIAVALLPQAIAQPQTPTPTRPGPTNFFQGRGVAQGAVFNRGRNANVSLTLDGNNFGLEMLENQPSNMRGQAPGRVQYRGTITRRNNEPGQPNSFSLNARVQSFDTSENLRIITNTTGTCRMEVFDARVISSSCNTVADNSSTEFLGLEQF